MSVFQAVIARVDHIAQATAATDETTELGECQTDGTLTEVSILPAAALTADATNYRIFQVVNKGQTGVGTTVMATLQTDLAGGSWVANDEKLMALSGTAANLLYSASDVLALVETHAGSGVAHPEMQVIARGTKR